jgi:cobalt-zinc-cadmium efflux system outer membrane protein
VRALVGELEPADAPLAKEVALEQILRDSPEIQFALAEVERDEVTVEREKREPIPNVIVRGAGGYNYEVGRPTADVSVGVRLPVWDRNEGTVAQAQADLARARAEVTRVELSVRRRFADTFQRYESALASVKDFREETLPKARKAYEVYQDYFKKRRATWPQVLVAERTLTQLNDEYVNALLELRRAEVDIRGLLLGDGGLTEPPGVTPQGHIDATPRPR